MNLHFKTRGVKTDYSAWQPSSTDVENAFSYLEDRNPSILLYRTENGKDLIVSSFIQDSGQRDYQKTPIRVLFSISDLEPNEAKKILLTFLENHDFLREEILGCISWNDQKEDITDNLGWKLTSSSSLKEKILQFLNSSISLDSEDENHNDVRFIFPLDEFEEGINLLRKYKFSNEYGIKFIYSFAMLHLNKAEEIKENADLIIANYKQKIALPAKKYLDKKQEITQDEILPIDIDGIFNKEENCKTNKNTTIENHQIEEYQTEKKSHGLPSPEDKKISHLPSSKKVNGLLIVSLIALVIGTIIIIKNKKKSELKERITPYHMSEK